jgi:hypothetical protein
LFSQTAFLRSHLCGSMNQINDRLTPGSVQVLGQPAGCLRPRSIASITVVYGVPSAQDGWGQHPSSSYTCGHHEVRLFYIERARNAVARVDIEIRRGHRKRATASTNGRWAAGSSRCKSVVFTANDARAACSRRTGHRTARAGTAPRGKSCPRDEQHRDRDQWQVTWPPGQWSGPGRLLVYCTTCRAEAGDNLWVAMPIALLAIDSNRVMLSLYEQELVGTDPEEWRTCSDSPGPEWTERKRRTPDTDSVSELSPVAAEKNRIGVTSFGHGRRT